MSLGILLPKVQAQLLSQCHYAECRYAECRVTVLLLFITNRCHRSIVVHYQ
jgi:hypothetical protein